MKKYRVIDEDGEKFDVEEIEVAKDECKDEDSTVECAHDEASILTEDELVILRKLLPVADKLIALVTETDETVGDEDEDEKIIEEDDEEVIDTDPEDNTKAHDSKKSVGAINKKVDDSEDLTDSISDAWAKRYNGGK